MNITITHLELLLVIDRDSLPQRHLLAEVDTEEWQVDLPDALVAREVVKVVDEDLEGQTGELLRRDVKDKLLGELGRQGLLVNLQCKVKGM